MSIFFVYGFLKLSIKKRIPSLEISSILALVALSVFSFANALMRICLVMYSFSSLPPNHGNPPDAFCFCFLI
jgi:hypothetical protein